MLQENAIIFFSNNQLFTVTEHSQMLRVHATTFIVLHTALYIYIHSSYISVYISITFRF